VIRYRRAPRQKVSFSLLRWAVACTPGGERGLKQAEVKRREGEEEASWKIQKENCSTLIAKLR